MEMRAIIRRGLERSFLGWGENDAIVLGKDRGIEFVNWIESRKNRTTPFGGVIRGAAGGSIVVKSNALKRRDT